MDMHNMKTNFSSLKVKLKSVEEIFRVAGISMKPGNKQILNHFLTTNFLLVIRIVT